VLAGTVRAVARLEIFDRSMTLSAQLFTSIFPLLILSAVLLGRHADDRIADITNVPDTTREVLGDAFGGSGAGAFGVVGSLVVVLSATSLARAITRAYAAIWSLPRVRSNPRDAWRWVAAVLLVTGAVVGVRLLSRLAGQAPLPRLSTAVLAFAADTAIALAVPWILLSGVVPARRLLPGAAAFAVVMLVLRPVRAVYLPHALQVSADRYGSIGLAFTYIGWFYALSFCCLATAAVGQVVAADESPLGRWIRGRPGALPGSPAVPRPGAVNGPPRP